MKKNNYRKIENWRRESKTFLIEIAHWYTKGRINAYNIDKNALSHKWNVYVYISPEHPFFDKMKESISDNYPFLEELHYGCTYCYWYRDENGSVTMKKYGSDYIHLNDDHFEDCDSEDHPYAREIFFDAERLFDSFKEAEDCKQGVE